MADILKSTTSPNTPAPDPENSGWVKIGVVAAASAFAGGLAAAWWYRKTLTKLRQTGENGTNPHFGIPAEDPGDDA